MPHTTAPHTPTPYKGEYLPPGSEVFASNVLFCDRRFGSIFFHDVVLCLLSRDTNFSNKLIRNYTQDGLGARMNELDFANSRAYVVCFRFKRYVPLSLQTRGSRQHSG